MSFNRRGGPDRRPDRFQRPDRDRGDRPDRPPRPEGGGDWQSRDRGPGGGRPFTPRGDRPYQPRPGGDRPYQPRPGGDRPYQPRPQFDRAPDEGAMSIRLDPRRVGVLKRLAAETGMRPGDLVRQWIEERLDAARQGVDTPDAAKQLTAQLAELAERVASLEAAAGLTQAASPPAPEPEADEPERESATDATDADPEPEAEAEPEQAAEESVDQSEPTGEEDAAPDAAAPRKRAKRVAASPSGPRVALHDEMIAVLSERGPMSAGDLAAAVAERGRYQPPRSGKPLDAAMVSQRVSNPVYRARFTRNEGRIGLAEAAE
jgi:23S rRNA pseudouridine2605 synthase